MIYTPEKHPKKSFALVTIMVVVGILGGYLISDYFMMIALVFWVQYTAVLSYTQFKRKPKYGFNTFTETLLHPQIRFFVFELIAVLAILSLIFYQTTHIGAAALTAWWLFALNFYAYYERFPESKIE